MSAPDLLTALEQCRHAFLVSGNPDYLPHIRMIDEALTPSSVDAVPVAWLWTLESTVGGGVTVTQADMRGPQFFKDRLGSDFSPFGRRGHDIVKDEAQVKITAVPLYAHPVPAKSEGVATRKEMFEQEARQLEAAAVLADDIACTSTDKNLRALLFAAEKNLRAAANIQADEADRA